MNIIAYIYDRFKLQKLNFTVCVLGAKHIYTHYQLTRKLEGSKENHTQLPETTLEVILGVR